MLRVGIIGSGFGLYGLLPAFASIPNCKVVALCGKKTERVTDNCLQYSVRHIYPTWKKMLEKESLDAVAIAVPPTAQYEIAREAIKRGIHVFAEKPLAVTKREAQSLYRLATHHRVVHAIDFLFPEIEQWRIVRQFIQNSMYGKLLHVSVSWNFLSHDIRHTKTSWKTDSSQGGGAVSFYFSHILYHLQYFVGSISSVKSVFSYTPAQKKRGEVGVDALFQFTTGVTGDAHLCCAFLGPPEHQMVFRCEKGTIVLESPDNRFDNFRIQTYTQGAPEFYSETREDARVPAVKRLAAQFITCCGSGEKMIPSFEEGVAVQDMIDRVRKSRLRAS